MHDYAASLGMLNRTGSNFPLYVVCIHLHTLKLGIVRKSGLCTACTLSSAMEYFVSYCTHLICCLFVFLCTAFCNAGC